MIFIIEDIHGDIVTAMSSSNLKFKIEKKSFISKALRTKNSNAVAEFTNGLTDLLSFDLENNYLSLLDEKFKKLANRFNSSLYDELNNDNKSPVIPYSFILKDDSKKRTKKLTEVVVFLP